jgi:hypothetical protein
VVLAEGHYKESLTLRDLVVSISGEGSMQVCDVGRGWGGGKGACRVYGFGVEVRIRVSGVEGQMWGARYGFGVWVWLPVWRWWPQCVCKIHSTYSSLGTT